MVTKTKSFRYACIVVFSICGLRYNCAAQGWHESVIFDRPMTTEKGIPTPDIGKEGGSLICYFYQSFVVKRLSSGTPSGDEWVGFVPVENSLARPKCSAQTSSAEARVKGDSHSFAGVRGNFVVMLQTDPNGSVPFSIFERRTGQLRYSDASFGDLRFIADEDGKLHLKYRRGVNASCSIPKDGQECWLETARNAHFPAVLVGWKAPVDSCMTVYRRQHVSVDDPSIIVYDVDVVVPPKGGPRVLSRGDPTCEPMP